MNNPSSLFGNSIICPQCKQSSFSIYLIADQQIIKNVLEENKKSNTLKPQIKLANNPQQNATNLQQNQQKNIEETKEQNSIKSDIISRKNGVKQNNKRASLSKNKINFDDIIEEQKEKQIDLSSNSVDAQSLQGELESMKTKYNLLKDECEKLKQKVKQSEQSVEIMKQQNKQMLNQIQEQESLQQFDFCGKKYQQILSKLVPIIRLENELNQMDEKFKSEILMKNINFPFTDDIIKKLDRIVDEKIEELVKQTSKFDVMIEEQLRSYENFQQQIRSLLDQNLENQIIKMIDEKSITVQMTKKQIGGFLKILSEIQNKNNDDNNNPILQENQILQDLQPEIQDQEKLINDDKFIN